TRPPHLLRPSQLEWGYYGPPGYPTLNLFYLPSSVVHWELNKMGFQLGRKVDLYLYPSGNNTQETGGIVVPDGFLLLVLFLIDAVLIWRLVKRRRTRLLIRDGHCPGCQYHLPTQLQAAHDSQTKCRCPECGLELNA